MNMTGHIHASAISFVVFTLYLLIALFFLKFVSTRLSDTAFGKALAYIVAG